MEARQPIPVRPVYPDPSRSFVRAATAKAICEITWADNHTPASEVLERMYPGDRPAALILRAATSPMGTGSTGAQYIQPVAVTEFVSGLLQTASGELIRRGMRLDLTNILSITIPHVLANAALTFVGEASPIPAIQRATSAVTLGPARAIRGIMMLTRELAEHSAANAEAVMTVLLQEAASRALDGAILSASASSSTTPAGILNSISGQTPTAGGGLNALLGDVQNLVGAISDAGGGNSILFIANPRQVAAMKLLAGPAFDYPAIGSSVLAAGTVICIDPACFVSGFSDVPLIEVGHSATIHMEDTTPLQIGTVGSPPTVAAPTISAFQIDSWGLRLTLRAAWALRAPLVSWVQSVTW